MKLSEEYFEVKITGNQKFEVKIGMSSKISTGSSEMLFKTTLKVHQSNLEVRKPFHHLISQQPLLISSTSPVGGPVRQEINNTQSITLLFAVRD